MRWLKWDVVHGQLAHNLAKGVLIFEENRYCRNVYRLMKTLVGEEKWARFAHKICLKTDTENISRTRKRLLVWA